MTQTTPTDRKRIILWILFAPLWAPWFVSLYLGFGLVKLGIWMLRWTGYPEILEAK